MAAKLNFRSVVFKRAHLIAKTGVSFSEALKEAWRRYRAYKETVTEKLAKRINSFDFFYMYSDSGHVYKRWRQEEREITNELETLPYSFIANVSGQLRKQSNISQFI